MSFSPLLLGSNLILRKKSHIISILVLHGQAQTMCISHEAKRYSGVNGLKKKIGIHFHVSERQIYLICQF